MGYPREVQLAGRLTGLEARRGDRSKDKKIYKQLMEVKTGLQERGQHAG